MRGAGATDALPPTRVRSKVVLNLAEIADGKRIQNQQIFCIHVVDLVSGVTGYEQGPPRVDAVHHVLNGDRAAS